MNELVYKLLKYDCSSECENNTNTIQYKTVFVASWHYVRNVVQVGLRFHESHILDNWYFIVHHHASKIYKFLTYCVPLSQPTPNCPTEHPPTQAETLDMPRGRNEQWPKWDEKRVRRTDRGEWTKRTTKVWWIHVKKESLINRWKKRGQWLKLTFVHLTKGMACATLPGPKNKRVLQHWHHRPCRFAMCTLQIDQINPSAKQKNVRARPT